MSWATYFTNSIMLPMPYPDQPGQPSAVPIYTFYPFTKGHCEEARTTLLTTIQPGNRLNSSTDLFPNKFRNMHGCPLTVSSFQDEPYVMIDQSKKGVLQLSGIDGYLVRILSQRMGFSVVVDVQTFRGVIFANKTATGALGRVWKFQ